MKKKIFIILIILFVMLGVFFLGRQVGLNEEQESTNIVKTEEKVSTQTIKKTLTSSGSVASKTTEKVALSTSKYFEAMCVEVDDTVSKGDKILKYTDGTYLKAPYDCYIVELNIPNEEGKCLNSHYVKIQSKNILTVSMSVSEENIDKISIGQEAKITISALEKEYTGYVTHIGSTASNGKFTIDIEFENDGNIKLGMTSSIEINI